MLPMWQLETGRDGWVRYPLEGTYAMTTNHCAHVENIAVLEQKIKSMLDNNNNKKNNQKVRFLSGVLLSSVFFRVSFPLAAQNYPSSIMYPSSVCIEFTVTMKNYFMNLVEELRIQSELFT